MKGMRCPASVSEPFIPFHGPAARWPNFSMSCGYQTGPLSLEKTISVFSFSVSLSKVASTCPIIASTFIT
jgi:hypothetical protein